MAHKLTWIAAAVVALAVSGPLSAQPSNPTTQDAAHWDASRKAASDASFEKDTHDACVGSAQGHGASAEAAERYCSCIVARLRPLSAEIKASLSQHPDVMSDASDSCKAH
jgi:hypothetical protein